MIKINEKYKKNIIKLKSKKTVYDGIALIKDKIYDALPAQLGWYVLVDEEGEDYAYPPELFDVIEQGEPLENEIKWVREKDKKKKGIKEDYKKNICKIKCINDDNGGYKKLLKRDKIYEALPDQMGWYVLIDEEGDYSDFPPELFELIETGEPMDYSNEFFICC